jgi:REP-associated tyrosine transposase
MTPHVRQLEAAYQLHYYLVLKTHYLRPLIATESQRSLIESVLGDVCRRERYHLLQADISEDHLRLLLSMRPHQKVSDVVKLFKGNTDRQFSTNFPQNNFRKLWARGYFARSSGKVNLKQARAYVDAQASHHGYKGDWTNALKYRNPAFKSPAFSLAHSFCRLNHHLVLATQNRIEVFDEVVAERLFDYVVAIGKKHEFAVERIGLLPDHMHLIVETRPDVSIEDCARALMDNTRYWMTKHFSGVLKQTQAWDLWQPSFYAGTVGEYSTAQVKKFFSAS